MRAELRHFWLALAGALLLAASASAALDLEQALVSLRELAARHPDDPDYSWAVGQALEAAGRDADAAQQMRAHLERWPERPSSGWRSLGRCEYRAGHFEPAFPPKNRPWHFLHQRQSACSFDLAEPAAST